jgi:predicted nucleic acid-binding protein
MAEELLFDWEHQAIDVYVPNHFHSEVISAFIRAQRRGRLSADEAGETIRDLLALPFVVCDVTPIAERAFAIAQSNTISGHMIACMWL